MDKFYKLKQVVFKVLNIPCLYASYSGESKVGIKVRNEQKVTQFLHVERIS